MIDAQEHDIPQIILSEPAALILRGQTFDASRPAVMAIINRTPDSFFAGNRHADLDSALRALDSAVQLGADIVDVGGVRAGSEGDPVGAQEEIERVVPFLVRARTAYPELLLSLDTWRAEVLRAAMAAPAPASTWSTTPGPATTPSCCRRRSRPERATSSRTPAAARRAPTRSTSPMDPTRSTSCAMWWRPLPREPHEQPPSVCRPSEFSSTPPWTSARRPPTRCGCCGIRAAVTALGFPVLQALSRKDFVGETLDLPTEERLEGSLAATAIAAWLGATVFRAHDVRATGAWSTWWPRSVAIGRSRWLSAGWDRTVTMWTHPQSIGRARSGPGRLLASSPKMTRRRGGAFHTTC
jgi:dihydropteroate synthase